MERSRGSASVALLVTALALVMLAQLFYLYAGREYEINLQDVRLRQLRLLCASAIESMEEKAPEGSRQWLTTVLYPGGVNAVLESRLSFSTDRLVRCLEVTAACGDMRQCLRRTEFSLPETERELARTWGIVCSGEVLGAEFLPAATLYTGGREVKLPRAESFAPWAIDELPMDVLRLNGLSRRFYYLDDYTGIEFDSGLNVCGGGLIAAQGNIVIGNGCTFMGQTLLVTEQKIIIRDNVRMPQVLLLAKKGIKIGKGCSIGGIMLCGGNVELTGSLDYTRDEDLVARFSSVYYIL